MFYATFTVDIPKYILNEEMKVLKYRFHSFLVSHFIQPKINDKNRIRKHPERNHRESSAERTGMREVTGLRPEDVNNPSHSLSTELSVNRGEYLCGPVKPHRSNK